MACHSGVAWGLQGQASQNSAGPAAARSLMQTSYFFGSLSDELAKAFVALHSVATPGGLLALEIFVQAVCQGHGAGAAQYSSATLLAHSLAHVTSQLGPVTREPRDWRKQGAVPCDPGTPCQHCSALQAFLEDPEQREVVISDPPSEWYACMLSLLPLTAGTAGAGVADAAQGDDTSPLTQPSKKQAL
ncbi:hypothetical protein ABPG75_003837 [Micractinium tetrahymenae]